MREWSTTLALSSRRRRRQLPASTRAVTLAVGLLAVSGVARAQQLDVLASFGPIPPQNSQAPLVQGTDGNFYGTTSQGGASNAGTVFQVTPDRTLTILHTFAGGPADGAYPQAGLIEGTDLNYYGTTVQGGASGAGTVFQITSTGAVTVLYTFTGGSDGAYPYAGLIQAADGNFYGTTAGGGASGFGTVFQLTPAGSLTVLYVFSGGADGSTPFAGVIQGTDGNFYGTTWQGGSAGLGTVFQVTPVGALTVLHAFTGSSVDGASPSGRLLQTSDGTFYGTTMSGGASGVGTVFQLLSAGGFATLYSFMGGTDGASPYAGLIQATDGTFDGTTEGGGAFGMGTVFQLRTDGTVGILHSFAGTDGATPVAGVIQGADGNLYGTTFSGATAGAGAVFQLTSSGALTVLHPFASGIANGTSPYAGVIQATDGNFYGTTSQGGASGAGAAFQLTPGGALTVLYTFTGGTTDGGYPYAGLLQGLDGNFYGTTFQGGASGAGTAFQLTPAGALTVLHAFTGGTSDGGYPYAGLIQGTDGNFYGTTYQGGASGAGTAFQLTPGGALTVLHAFTGGSSDGGYPHAGLFQGTDGNFYGTTSQGGASGAGTAFQLTPSGALTVLHAFTGGSSDGGYPYAGLIQGTDGNFYGTTSQGGASGAGTAFQLTPGGGALTVLHAFAGGTSDGGYPYAGLIQGIDGSFYGTTASGGAFGAGTLFQLTPAGVLTVLHGFSGGPTDGASPSAGLLQTSDGQFYGTTESGGAFGGGTVFRLSNPTSEMITWTTPAPIGYGTALSGAQLNATANVPGTFSYTPPAGTVLPAGSQALTVTFTPADTTVYTIATRTVTLTVMPVAPAITWNTPAPILYGTALGASQLNATTNAAGTFAYTPGAGAVLGVGAQTLSVTFTPADTADYTTATRTVTLTVMPLTAVVTWNPPMPVSYGTALSAAQLNATANVPGTFSYMPPAGTVLPAGSQTLTATFTPADLTTYATTMAAVPLSVTVATPVITWNAPAGMLYGTALGASQLDATANAAGTFVYTPPAGTVLAMGVQTVSVTFTPTDTADYTTATSTVTLNVAIPDAGSFTNSGGSTGVASGVTISSNVATPAGTVTLNCPATTTGSCAGGSFVYQSNDGTTSISAGFTSGKYTESCAGGGRGGHISCGYSFTGYIRGTWTVNGLAQAITGVTSQGFGTGGAAARGTTAFNSAYTPFYYSDSEQILRSDDLQGTNQISYGSQGSGVGQFYGAYGIALDRAGRIYIIDTYNCRIVRIDDMQGANWTSYGGTCGSGQGQFYDPSGIAVDPSGRIYVMDTGNSRFIRIDDMTGANWTSFGTVGSGVDQFLSYQSVAIDASGRIYIADTGNLRVVRIDDMTGANWTVLKQSPPVNGYSYTFESPVAVAFDSTGRIYVADSYGNAPAVVRVDDMTGADWTSITVGAIGGAGLNSISVDSGGIVYAGGGGARVVDDMAGVLFSSGSVGPVGSYYVFGVTAVPLPSPRPSAISFSPAALTFTENVGASASQSVTIANFGGSPLNLGSMSASSGFSVDPTGCPNVLVVGSSCTAAVTFAPLVTGPANGLLTVNDDSGNWGSVQEVTLTGLGTAPVASVAPGTLAFSAEVVGTTSEARSIVVQNVGNGPMQVASVIATAPFSQTNTCGGTIAPGASCAVLVSFAPTAMGSASGTLTIADNAGTQTVTLTGTGRAPVMFSSSSLNLGTVAAGDTSAARTVTLTNRLNVGLTFGTIVASAGFAVASNTCGTGIGAGATCTVGVTFSPTAAGAAAGTLTFTDSAATSPQSVSLTGTGIPPVTFSSSSLSFGTVTVGTTSGARTVTLTNRGNVSLTCASIVTSAGFAVASNTCGTGVAAGATCTVGVTFSPTVAGAATGTLTFTDSAVTSPETVSLTGTGG